MSELSTLPNVGKVLEKSLNKIGITTPEALRERGARQTFLDIRQQVDSGACLHMLYGIQGAIEGIPDKELAKDTKDDLKDFYHSLKV